MSEMENKNFKIPTTDPFFQFREQTGMELQEYVNAHNDTELNKSIEGLFSVKSTKEEWGGFAQFTEKWGIPISHIISAASAYPGVSMFCGLVLSFFPFLGYTIYEGTTQFITVATILGFVLAVALLYGIEMGFDYFLYKLVPKLQNKALRTQYGKSLWFYWVGTILFAIISFSTSYFGATEAPKMVIKAPTEQVATTEDITAPSTKSMDLISEQAKSYDSQIAAQQRIIDNNAGKDGWKAGLARKDAKKAMERLQHEKVATVGNLTGLGITTVKGIETRNASADSTTRRLNRKQAAEYERRVWIGSWLNGGISIFAQIGNALGVIFLCWFKYSVLKESSQISKQTTIQNTPNKTHQTNPQTNQQALAGAAANVFGSGVEDEIDEKPALSKLQIRPVTYEGVEYSIKDIQDILKKIKPYYKRAKKPLEENLTGANRIKSINSKKENLDKVKTWSGVLSCIGVIVTLYDDGTCKISY